MRINLSSFPTFACISVLLLTTVLPFGDNALVVDTPVVQQADKEVEEGNAQEQRVFNGYSRTEYRKLVIFGNYFWSLFS